MKVRMKFTKTGPIRFVGHLDFMRYFTRAVARSSLPGVYTNGFSPHLIISFAAPLGVGEETLGDYADVELAYKDPYATEEELFRLEHIGLKNDELPAAPSASFIKDSMNRVLSAGVEITAVTRVGQTKTSKAMALVRYASYEIRLKDSFLPGCGLEKLAQAAEAFMARNEIIIHKKTKKSEADVDIRPLILSLRAGDGTEPSAKNARSLFLTCATGSTKNLKPAAVIEAFCSYLNDGFDPYGFRIIRLETMAEDAIPLSGLGEEI